MRVRGSGVAVTEGRGNRGVAMEGRGNGGVAMGGRGKGGAAMGRGEAIQFPMLNLAIQAVS